MNPSIREGLQTLAERGRPRGADAVLASAQHRVRRRQRGLQAGFAFILSVLVAVGVSAYMLSRDGDDRGADLHTEPEQPELTPPPVEGAMPDEIDGVARPLPDVQPITIWISEPVIPATGADVVLALRSTAGGDQMYGVPIEVDRWDGSSWTRVAGGATCVGGWACVGQISPQGPEGWEDIGVRAPAGGTGTAEWLHLGGLESGFYRLRKESNEHVVATGMFAVVDEPVPLVPVAAPGDRRIDVVPPLLPQIGGAISVYPRVAPASLTIATETVQRWDGAAWQDVPGQMEVSFVGVSIQTLNTADMAPRRLPDLQPGPYRLRWTFTDGTQASGPFWVDDGREPTRTADGRLVLDEGRLVVEDLPSEYRPLTVPTSGPTVGGGATRSLWELGRTDPGSILAISVVRGPDVHRTLDELPIIEGVTRQGAPVHRTLPSPAPGAIPIGWSPAPGVVVWLGSNSSQVDLVSLSAGVRYEDPPAR